MLKSTFTAKGAHLSDRDEDRHNDTDSIFDPQILWDEAELDAIIEKVRSYNKHFFYDTSIPKNNKRHLSERFLKDQSYARRAISLVINTFLHSKGHINTIFTPKGYLNYKFFSMLKDAESLINQQDAVIEDDALEFIEFVLNSRDIPDYQKTALIMSVLQEDIIERVFDEDEPGDESFATLINARVLDLHRKIEAQDMPHTGLHRTTRSTVLAYGRSDLRLLHEKLNEEDKAEGAVGRGRFPVYACD